MSKPAREHGFASVTDRGPGGYLAEVSISGDACEDTQIEALDKLEAQLKEALRDVRSLRAMLVADEFRAMANR